MKQPGNAQAHVPHRHKELGGEDEDSELAQPTPTPSNSQSYFPPSAPVVQPPMPPAYVFSSHLSEHGASDDDLDHVEEELAYLNSSLTHHHQDAFSHQSHYHHNYYQTPMTFVSSPSPSNAYYTPVPVTANACPSPIPIPSPSPSSLKRHREDDMPSHQYNEEPMYKIHRGQYNSSY